MESSLAPEEKRRKDSSIIRKSNSSKEDSKEKDNLSNLLEGFMITEPRQKNCKKESPSPPDNESLQETNDTAVEESKNIFRSRSEVPEDIQGISKKIMVVDYKENLNVRYCFLINESRTRSEISGYSGNTKCVH